MIATIHSIAMRASVLVRRAPTRVFAFYRAAIQRACAMLAAIARFLGG